MFSKVISGIAMLSCAGLAVLYLSSYQTSLELSFGLAFGLLALLHAIGFYKNEKRFTERIGFVTTLVYITWGFIRFYGENFKLLLTVLAFASCATGVNNKFYINEIEKFQTELNHSYRNPDETPLRGKNFENFKAHPFFNINPKYRVEAHLKRTLNPVPFEMPTSSGETKRYEEFGTLHFSIDGRALSLKVFQSITLREQEAYKDYLFLPFRDLTANKETYGGGKYLDLRIPEGDKIILDFNRSYHPYCAYNAFDYSCPIVPKENWLPVRIEAGVKYEDRYFEH